MSTPDTCERCDAPWAGDKCSASDCYCTLCPFCGQQAVDPDGCEHLVALFFEGSNMLSYPPDPGELEEQPSEVALREAFGDDFDLAMEIWRDDFTCSPSEKSREWPLLRRIKQSYVIEGRMDTGWMGDGPWTVVYMPGVAAWERFRDEKLRGLGERLAGIEKAAQ